MTQHGPVDPLRELVAVMDRLRSPGGCSWDAQQTHASLVPFLLEEAHELAEAVDADDRAGLREELGDVLLQVVFHARVAQEHADDPFGIDDVARDVAAKLVRRHPHVFTDAVAPADSHVQWDRIKKVEKGRESALDGVPASLPALARAQKIAARATRAGLDVPAAATATAPPAPATAPPAPATAPPAPATATPAPATATSEEVVVLATTSSDAASSSPVASDDVVALATTSSDAGEGGGGVSAPGDLGRELLALALRAHDEGLDAEGELRRAVAALEAALRAQEAGPDGTPSATPRENRH